MKTKSGEKSQRIDLGLALLARRTAPGGRWPGSVIAAWCGCSQQAIWQIERGALRKVRGRLNLARQLSDE